MVSVPKYSDFKIQLCLHFVIHCRYALLLCFSFCLWGSDCIWFILTQNIYLDILSLQNLVLEANIERSWVSTLAFLGPTSFSIPVFRMWVFPFPSDCCQGWLSTSFEIWPTCGCEFYLSSLHEFTISEYNRSSMFIQVLNICKKITSNYYIFLTSLSTYWKQSLSLYMLIFPHNRYIIHKRHLNWMGRLVDRWH